MTLNVMQTLEGLAIFGARRERGVRLWRTGRVRQVEVARASGTVQLHALVDGEQSVYRVTGVPVGRLPVGLLWTCRGADDLARTVLSPRLWRWSCDCPDDVDVCKHTVAALLQARSELSADLHASTLVASQVCRG